LGGSEGRGGRIYFFRTSPESRDDFASHAEREGWFRAGIGSDYRGSGAVWSHGCSLQPLSMLFSLCIEFRTILQW